ncbi:MAG TPA: bacillithiol biosynthesis BshC, partial [Chitinophagaceae bacterium]|nr:bacillithiol biosynthesis BshC [Chitinophagaceae bacterium]
MDCNSTSLPYEQIGFFSRIIVDYLKESDQLKPFYQHPASLDGLRESVAARKNFPTDRKKLVEVLGRQYALAGPSEKVMANIARLRDENTFTIVTAH